MNEPGMLAVFLAYLEQRNATQNQVRTFIVYWKAAHRDGSVPCPICYTFRGRHCGLTALHETDGYTPLVCPGCKETFNVPRQ